MLQSGFFDLEDRFGKLDQLGDPLKALNAVVDWSVFEPILASGLAKEKKGNAGRPVTFPPLLLFKVLILQSLYNLADAQTEFQIRDRFTFLRFLGLTPESRIPDEKTIWLFRESVKSRGLYDELFATFSRFLGAQGLRAQQGTVIDARIVEVPRQRNTRSENATIKEGLLPEAWEKHTAKKAQKDIDARWTQKNGKHYYGYKNHIAIDAKHKFIRRYQVTAAHVHDSQCFEPLLDRRNGERTVYADSAYRSEAHERLLKRKRFKSRVHHRAWRDQTLTKREQRENRARSRIRARVEHVFGHQVKAMRQTIVRGIGLARIRTRIALANLAYNMSRLAQLRPLPAS
jgi:IS5 family transposase